MSKDAQTAEALRLLKIARPDPDDRMEFLTKISEYLEQVLTEAEAKNIKDKGMLN
jgi:hypothetical protein